MENTMDYIFDSQKTEYKDPFGAVEAQSEIIFRVKISAKLEVSCQLVIFCEGKEKTFKMEQEKKEKEDMEYNIFSLLFKAPEKPCVLFYYFSIQNKDKKIFLGNNVDRLGGEGFVYDVEPVPYQITIHKKGIKVPTWYKEGIMYQIFVDRFNKGGQEDLYEGRKGFVKYTNWHDKNRYIKNSKGEIVYWDVFGGNFKGIIEKISYLKDLGVSIIYLNPVFEANSNHKYDTADYEKIDSGFGSEEDFDEFIEECRKNGINVILDGVFSHVGNDSKYFNMKGNYDSLGAFQSKESPYYEWFRFNNYPYDYDCWWKNLSLPNVNEMHPSYVEYILTGENSIVKRWLKRGIKGWRLDVADELPDEFIKILKEETYKQDSDSIVLGEVWEDASNKESYGELRKYFLGDELDSVMNYPFRTVFIDFILGKIGGEQALRSMMSLYENYPKEYYYASMNHIGTHDTVRALTIFGEGPKEYKIEDDEAYNYELPVKNYKCAIKRMKLISFIQAIFPGVPCIYYGDEAGMQGFRDPYCRGTYPWGKEDKELIEWYKKIFKFRETSEVLKKGSWYAYKCEGSIFSIIREYEGEKLLCAVNVAFEPRALSLPITCVHELLTDKDMESQMLLEGLSCYIFKMKTPS
jgi:4-alpha-glucanotransferase